MTKTDLEAAIRRHSRYRSVILFIMATAVFGTPIANIVFRIPVEVFLCLFFGIPILGFIAAYGALRVFGVRCPHCEAFLGMEKKKFYDVIATGRCRKCGKSVIHDVA